MDNRVTFAPAYGYTIISLDLTAFLVRETIVKFLSNILVQCNICTVFSSSKAFFMLWFEWPTTSRMSAVNGTDYSNAITNPQDTLCSYQFTSSGVLLIFLDVPRSFPKKTFKKLSATSRPLQQLKNYSDKKLDCNGLCPVPGQSNTFLLVDPNNDAIKRVTLGKCVKWVLLFIWIFSSHSLIFYQIL